jgi:hypothetical protein
MERCTPRRMVQSFQAQFMPLSHFTDAQIV